MKTKFSILLLAGLLAATGIVRAQEDTNHLAQLKEIAGLAKNLKYQQGDIDLRGGLAKLTVPKEFNFLGPEDADTVLVKLWGNPPSNDKPLGLLIPAGMTPLSSNAWVVTIDYTEDGYVKDKDASKINYDDLLKKMQKGIEVLQAQRQLFPAETALAQIRFERLATLVALYKALGGGWNIAEPATDETAPQQVSSR